jgi:conjugal transfer/entry exclusion protein
MIILLLLILQTHQITQQTKIKGLIITQARAEPLIVAGEYPLYE